MEYLTAGVVFGGIAALVLYGVASSNQSESDRLESAIKEYKDKLDALTKDPINSALRQQTLQLGREIETMGKVFSTVATRRHNLTRFNEVAVMNDINAACAGAVTLSKSGDSPSLVSEKNDIKDRLAKLESLKKDGLIQEQEYQDKRQELIKQI